MGSSRRTAQLIQAFWGLDCAMFVLGAADESRCQASIPPRKGCG